MYLMTEFVPITVFYILGLNLSHQRDFSSYDLLHYVLSVDCPLHLTVYMLMVIVV